jgi:hypothetical protein
MADDKRVHLQAEGEPSKKFRIYTTDIKNDPYECGGEYDTVAEVIAHKWRLDKKYKIRVPGNKYLTKTEFYAWA